MTFISVFCFFFLKSIKIISPSCTMLVYPLFTERKYLAVFILETRYPSGRASANILQIVRLSVSSIKTGTRRITRLDELLFETRLERRISKSSSSRRVTRLLPVFILERRITGRITKYLPKLVQTGNASLV